MTLDPAAVPTALADPSVAPVQPASAAHLVVKRGHRGRYRLTLMIDGVCMKGDLTVEGVERADRAADRSALALFARAAAALAEAITSVHVKP